MPVSIGLCPFIATFQVDRDITHTLATSGFGGGKRFQDTFVPAPTADARQFKG